jgi:hypothetical protein
VGRFVAGLFRRVPQKLGNAIVELLRYLEIEFIFKMAISSLEEAQFYIKLDFQISKKFNNGIHKFLWYATKWPREEITREKMTGDEI